MYGDRALFIQKLVCFKKKLFRRTLGKWEKEHITVNYNYQTTICVIFSSKFFLEVAFLWGFRLSARLQGFCRGFFFPLCIHFWCVSDVALLWNKCLTTINLAKKWLTSPIEVFHIKKSPQKGTKVFAEGIFPVENLFLARGANKCPKNMPEKFQGCAIFVPGVISKRRSTMMDRHSSSPKYFLGRPP